MITENRLKTTTTKSQYNLDTITAASSDLLAILHRMIKSCQQKDHGLQNAVATCWQPIFILNIFLLCRRMSHSAHWNVVHRRFWRITLSARIFFKHQQPFPFWCRPTLTEMCQKVITATAIFSFYRNYMYIFLIMNSTSHLLACSTMVMISCIFLLLLLSVIGCLFCIWGWWIVRQKKVQCRQQAPS